MKLQEAKLICEKPAYLPCCNRQLETGMSGFLYAPAVSGVYSGKQGSNHTSEMPT